MPDATVIGGGISGIACATSLAEAGTVPQVRERGHRLAGRMASRTLRGTGTAHDGRVADIGASYFTVRDPDFRAVIDALMADGVVREWTTSFHVHGPEGMAGIASGPMRYAAPGGLRSVVEAMAAGLDVRLEDEVAQVEVGGARVLVDGVGVDAAAVCIPEPQARRITQDVPVTRSTWEPIIAVTLVFADRTWGDIDGVFVNDDPVLTWIADDGRRRGDEAPVLVAHMHPVLSARHVDAPAEAIPAAVAAVQRVLGIPTYPDWVDAHRWTYAKPLVAAEDPCWVHPEVALGVAGDAWAGGPRVEAAWLSGRQLGKELAGRLG